MYLSDEETAHLLKDDSSELWRIVRFEPRTDYDDWICWIQEREWRCPYTYPLGGPSNYGIFVKTSEEARQLYNRFYELDQKPMAILPLDVLLALE